MSQFTNCRYVVLTSLCPPPRGPNTFFYNGSDIYISNSFIYLGKDSDCWKMKLLPSVHPSLESPFPILSTCFGDNFGGDTVSSRALCWRAEQWYWNSLWDRPSNVVYQNPAVGNPFFYLCGLPEILLKFPRSQCFLQLDHRHWKKYSKGYVEAQWHLLWLQGKCEVDLFQKEFSWLWFSVLSIKERICCYPRYTGQLDGECLGM